MRRPLIAGNWKMHCTRSEAINLTNEIIEKIGPTPPADVAVAPPFLAIALVVDIARSTPILVGAQNCHFEAKGAFTGEVSLPMLAEVGAKFVILGHSERRHVFGETDELVHKKMDATLKAGLMPILCVGETLAERDGGATLDVVGRQLSTAFEGLGAEQAMRTTIAYEPVWAIGTGRNATPDQAQEVHAFVRKWLAEKFGDVAERVRIQYGGSVNAGNAKELLSQPDVDGALVGGASLKADTFAAIVAATEK
jgi:triosephosphate isomerase